MLWHNTAACVSSHFQLKGPLRGQQCSNAVIHHQSLFIERWVAQVQSVCQGSHYRFTPIHSFIPIKSGGSSSIDKKIYLRQEQGGVGKLAKPRVKTKAAGNEKWSEATNHTAFLTNGYQRVTGSKVEALRTPSPAVCHEGLVEPPMSDPRESTLPPGLSRDTSGPHSTTAATYYVEDGRTDGQAASVLFVCHLLTSFQPRCASPPRWSWDWQAQRERNFVLLVRRKLHNGRRGNLCKLQKLLEGILA